MTALLQSPSHHLHSAGTSQLTILSPSPEVEGIAEEGVESGEGSSNVEGQRRGRRRGGGGGGGKERRREQDEEEEEEQQKQRQQQQQLSLVALFLTILRRSLISSCTTESEESRSMEIGWPTEVRHVAHVTFDRFHGFLGLPSEFQTDVSSRAPSASTTVFGVSTESMQCSYDSRGNSIPSILLLMQRCLYVQGGLQAEGIFRITADNAQEEHVRDQLNHGIVPENIDVHCLAGLIKAWFRELPSGLLDTFTPEQLMECESEDDYVNLLGLLPPAESALLNWAINLMADVVQEELLNKMNAHNVATVFAPNMTQMSDPINALMHAVHVMNFLKSLIMKTLKERKDSIGENGSPSKSEPSDQSDHHGPSEMGIDASDKENYAEQDFLGKNSHPENPSDVSEDYFDTNKPLSLTPDASSSRESGCSTGGPSQDALKEDYEESQPVSSDVGRQNSGQMDNLDAMMQQPKNPNAPPVSSAEKAKGILMQISSRTERAEAWR